MKLAARAFLRSLPFVFAAHCAPPGGALTSSHAAAMQDSVRSALATYQRYSASAEWDSLVGLYRDDSTFSWIEDGRRSRSAAVRKTLTSIPGLKVETAYDSTEIIPLAPGIASVTANYRTTFVGANPPVQFHGAISMIWKHDAGGWKIWSGHSSGPRGGD